MSSQMQWRSYWTHIKIRIMRSGTTNEFFPQKGKKYWYCLWKHAILHRYYHATIQHRWTATITRWVCSEYSQRFPSTPGTRDAIYIKRIPPLRVWFAPKRIDIWIFGALTNLVRNWVCERLVEEIIPLLFQVVRTGIRVENTVISSENAPGGVCIFGPSKIAPGRSLR